MTELQGEQGDESILKMIPIQTKIYFLFVLTLIIVIILVTLSLNEYLFFFFDRLADAVEDLKEYLYKCRKGHDDDEFQQTTGRTKTRKRYRRKYRRRKYMNDEDEEREDEEEEEEDDDSDDEVVMAYWKMVESEKRFDEASFKTSALVVPLALASGSAHSLKLQMGFRYQHRTGGVNCHVIKLSGLVAKVLKQEPWNEAGGLFVRFLLLTKDGLILNKEDSKTKKVTSATAGEISYDQYFNFQIPLCQINNVILLVSLFVVLSVKQEKYEKIKKKDGEGDQMNGDKNGDKNCDKDSSKDIKLQEKSVHNSAKKAALWISFGLNPSSKRTNDQWTLMVEHSDEVKIWHDLTRTPIF